MTPAWNTSDDELLSRELDGKLLHLRGLILVRRLLAERSATQAELDTHSEQIHELRAELARAFAEPLAGPPPLVPGPARRREPFAARRPAAWRETSAA